MRLIISPACDAARICREAGPSHLVRFVSPDQADVRADRAADKTLTLTVHDIAAPIPGRIAPDEAMVQAMLDFSADWRGAHPLVAQCWAGVSRSTAAAFIIACQKRPDTAEQDLAIALRRAAPQATPNSLMVAHADALLERAGRMRAAADAIGRGAEFVGFRSAELDLASFAP